MANEGDPSPVVFDANGHPVSAETVVEAYIQRCFPMSDDRDGPLAWYRPQERAIITWDRYKIPRSLQKTWRRAPFRLTHDKDFAAIICACADRESTWIGHDIEQLYLELHRLGIAHSVEAWSGDELVGGLYGLALGGAFCGESMFHRANDASKLCVIYLIEHLQKQGFQLLDCQQQTPHMQRFGAYVVDDEDYADLFEAALQQKVQF